MIELLLAQHPRATVVDDDDSWALDYTWSLSDGPGGSYALRHVTKPDGTYGKRLLHREILSRAGILPPDSAMLVDHIDGDGLNNRRANLRPATKSQNQANGRHLLKPHKTSSPYRGVYFEKARRRWRAAINSGGRTRSLGVFPTAEDAAVAYNVAALDAFGEFATLNPVGDWASHQQARSAS